MVQNMARENWDRKLKPLCIKLASRLTIYKYRGWTYFSSREWKQFSYFRSYLCSYVWEANSGFRAEAKKRWTLPTYIGIGGNVKLQVGERITCTRPLA